MENNTIIQLRDTIGDTKKIFVPMNTKFVIRDYVNKDGTSQIYLTITHKKKRKRINLDLKIPPAKFDKKKECIICTNKQDRDIQLILDNVKSKITSIKTYYRLSEQVLTIDKLEEELKNNIPRGEFTSFFEYELEKDKSIVKPRTYERMKSTLSNLRKYKSEIYFSEITEDFIHTYKSYFRKTRNANTYYSNLRVIKKYLRRALKSGIKLAIDLDNIKALNTRANRTDLNPIELKKVYNYYFSEYIFEGEVIPLATFLFACFTSLRISDISRLDREQVLTGTLSFIAEKTGKEHRIIVNHKAMEIVKKCPKLFVKKISEQYINSTLKEISRKLNIKKRVTLHVGRHTFATNYLRAGGKVEQLQLIMGHSEIRETMGYVHIVEQEKDDSLFLLDKLF